MQGLNSINGVLKAKGEEFIDELFNKYVVINEKLNGSYFAVKLNANHEYEFFKKNGSITHADRVLNKFYNKAIHHFEELSEEVKLEIPEFYVYCFEYFPNTSRLVLSHIHEVDGNNAIHKTLNTKALLEGWARTLLVENPPIFFEGRLSEDQKKAIKEYIYTQDADIAETFHSVPFKDFLGTVLDIKRADVEGLVFRFYEDEARDETTVNILKLISSEIEAIISDQKKTKTIQRADDFIWLILMDLMNFIESLANNDILAIDLNETSPQLKYVELVNALFVKYMNDYGAKWEGLEIRIPEYLKSEEFSLNTDLIKNPEVLNLIEKDQVTTEIYRVMLNSFRNPNIKINSPLFSDTMKYNLKSQVERLSHLILQHNTNESYFSTYYDFVGQ